MTLSHITKGLEIYSKFYSPKDTFMCQYKAFEIVILLYSTLLIYIWTTMRRELQQNPISTTQITLDRCQITEYSSLPDGLTGNFLLLLLHLGCTTSQRSIPFRYILHLLVWSLHSWRSWWNRRQGVRIYEDSCCTDTLGGLFENVPEICQ